MVGALLIAICACVKQRAIAYNCYKANIEDCLKEIIQNLHVFKSVLCDLSQNNSTYKSNHSEACKLFIAKALFTLIQRVFIELFTCSWELAC